MKFIGTTETYDPSFIFDWENFMQEVNLIITKNLNDRMIRSSLIHKDKIILHHTVTGLGGTVFEPNVPESSWSYAQFLKLIAAGFPVSHYVLRVDPIIPFSTDNIYRLCSVLNKWREYATIEDIKIRCRVSMIDMYNHVKVRFDEAKVGYPYMSFNASKDYFNRISEILSKFTDRLEFEACGETRFNPEVVKVVSCASTRDIEILGKNPDDYGFPAKAQRWVCGCLAKKQILRVKPGRCPNKCLYCYWKD